MHQPSYVQSQGAERLLTQARGHLVKEIGQTATVGCLSAQLRHGGLNQFRKLVVLVRDFLIELLLLRMEVFAERPFGTIERFLQVLACIGKRAAKLLDFAFQIGDIGAVRLFLLAQAVGQLIFLFTSECIEHVNLLLQVATQTAQLVLNFGFEAVEALVCLTLVLPKEQVAHAVEFAQGRAAR